MKPYAKRGLRYANDVVDGKIPAGKLIRLACQRHLADLERTDWEWTFDAKRGERICKLAEKMPHIKGRWGSKTIELQDWQCFLLTSVFGWVHKKTGIRRFRKALVVVPRKNAKSTIAAIVGLYLFAFDKEAGAEVYSAATTRDQAAISWDAAKRMCSRLPRLIEEQGIDILAHAIVQESTGSVFRALASEAHTLEGLNVHGAIVDEVHAHKTREVWDVIDDATGSRLQPLIFAISTEGDAAEGVLPEQVNYLEKILTGAHEDDRYFGLYYSIDPEDDWTTEEAWRKANPNYGVSVFAHDMQTRCRQAIQNPGSQASFLTKRLNVRVGAGDAYFNMLAWKNLCLLPGLRLEDFYSETCIITLDLANKWDLAAKVLLFERDGHCYAFSRCYLPESALEEGQPNYDIYRGWQAANRIEVTPGNTTDFAFIQRDLEQDCRNFQVARIGYDPYQAHKFIQDLQAAGMRQVLEVPSTVMNFSDPMKHLNELIMTGRIHHDGDPVLTYALGNVVAKVDAKENVYPVKSRPMNKIDPAVALIAGLSVAIHERRQVSVYTLGAAM